VVLSTAVVFGRSVEVVQQGSHGGPVMKKREELKEELPKEELPKEVLPELTIEQKALMQALMQPLMQELSEVKKEVIKEVKRAEFCSK